MTIKTLTEVKSYLADTRVKMWNDDRRLALYAPDSNGGVRFVGECGCDGNAIAVHNFDGFVTRWAIRDRWLQSQGH